MADLNPILIQPPIPSSNINVQTVPLVLIHDGGGTVFQYFLLSPIFRPLYGIANPHFESGAPWHGGLREMAAYYAKLIKMAIPSGQILLGGWSLGGYLALEIAHILARDREHEVLGLIMIDSCLPDQQKDAKSAIARQPDPLRFVDDSVSQKRKAQVQRCFSQAGEMLQAWTPPSWGASGDFESDNRRLTEEIPSSAQPPPTVLLRAVDRVPRKDDGDGADDPVDDWRDSNLLGWEQYDRHFIHSVLDVSGHHFNIFDEQNLKSVSTQLRQACDILEHHHNQNKFSD
ncbi:hypothetical protein MMC07_003459 [Pseudocyphellaria aurata]|nr:hypothetical protein [Pseudocyphellaria aurata]